MCKGWFHHPNTHWLTVHLWQNVAGQRGGDRPAGGNRSGSVWAWPGRSVLFVGPLIRAHLLTTSKRVVVWPAAIVRPPGETGAGTAPPSAFPCQYIQQTPMAACASDAAEPITGGLGAVSHQQAAQGIYLCIACYQCL